MWNIVLILIAIELGIRIFPLLDSLAELCNHFIAIGIQKCDHIIRKIAVKSEQEEAKLNKESHQVIGFCTEEES